MTPGKRFEMNFKKSAILHDIWILRLKDAGGWSESEQTRFTVDNPCDYILFTGAIVFPMELKAAKGKSVSTSRLEKQLPKLLDMMYLNVEPCIVFEFYEQGKAFITPAIDIHNKIEQTGKKSINIIDLESIHSTRLLAITKKKVNSMYDLSILKRWNDGK